MHSRCEWPGILHQLQITSISSLSCPVGIMMGRLVDVQSTHTHTHKHTHTTSGMGLPRDLSDDIWAAGGGARLFLPRGGVAKCERMHPLLAGKHNTCPTPIPPRGGGVQEAPTHEPTTKTNMNH